MQKMFNNILVPLRYNSHSAETIAKAIAFANDLGCHLNLLFVSRDTIWRSLFGKNYDAKQRLAIQMLGNRFQDEMRKGLRLSVVFGKGKLSELVSKYAALLDTDLIVDGCNESELHQPHEVSGDNSESWECPVLSINSCSLFKSLQAIILPIGGNLPIVQMRLAVYLARHFNAAIHLVSMEEESKDDKLTYMQRAYKVLKNNTDLQVLCRKVSGRTLERATMEYSGQIQSGLVMMKKNDSFPERGILSKIFAGSAAPPAKVPVITVG